MSIIYDLIFLLFALIYLPVFLFRRKIHSGFGMRLGFLPDIPDMDRPIWCHAVSVGEAMSIRHLVESLKESFPGKRFVISTVTPTGNKIARSIAGNRDLVIYLPLDLSWIVRRVAERIKPSLLVIAETEIWPNLITGFYRKKIPIVVVNARISDRSFKKYLRVRFLVKPVLNKVSFFCVQTPEDALRLRRLGVAEDRIRITGNMKFDIKIRDYEDLRKDYADYRVKFGLGAREKLLVAASTHPGEEEKVIEVYLDLVASFPDLKLMIAPRHPQRSSAVEQAINKYPLLEGLRISQLAGSAPAGGSPGRKQVFILDTVGQLMYFYAISDIVFVGGSLVKRGGHNILEPASLGKPVLFGKYMFNFRDIAEMFLKKQAGIMVDDTEDLKMNLRDLLRDGSRMARLGRSGREVILENQGATGRNAAAIRDFLETLKTW